MKYHQVQLYKEYVTGADRKCHFVQYPADKAGSDSSQGRTERKGLEKSIFEEVPRPWNSAILL